MKTVKFVGTNKQGAETSAEVTFPEWCTITVHRLVQGNRVPFPGPRVFWLEFYNKKSRFTDEPNEQWRRRPSQMLEKCAEAGALRRAFPEEFGEDYTVEEIGAFGSLATSAKAVDAEVVATTSPVEPKRGDFTEAQASEQAPDDRADDADHDPETGEVRSEAGKPAADEGVKAEASPWYPEGAGQEEVTKAIVALVKSDKVKSLADLDAVEAANKDRVAKYTQGNRAAINVAMDDRREEFDAGRP